MQSFMKKKFGKYGILQIEVLRFAGCVLIVSAPNKKG